MKKELLIPYFILICFIIPWSIIGLGQHEIRIKELFIILLLILLSINFLKGRKIYIDRPGKFYFYFIVVCIFYALINLIRLSSQNEINLLLHILIFTILNFTIYFIIINLRLDNFNLKKFVNVFFVIYLSIFAYFLYYANNLHILGLERIGGFFTVESEMVREGKLKIYIGGANGKSWFFLILSSFFVGYFINKNSYLKVILVIIMSFTISLYLLSRGALIFSSFLLIFFILSSLRKVNIKKLLFFISLFFITLISVDIFSTKTYKVESIVLNAFQVKEGFSNRDKLVFDSINIIKNDNFIGRGFHYTALNKNQLLEEGYEAIGKNNPQNTILSIFIELGLIGVLLFISFWTTLYLKFSKMIKYASSKVDQSFINGVKIMVTFIIFSFLFNHHYEKNFTATPIYMTLIALASKNNISKLIKI